MLVQGIIDSSLALKTVSLPPLAATQMLIKVYAAGVNRADYLQALGKYPLPPDASPVFGLECAGEVIEIGEQVTAFQKSDRVMSLVNGGAFATYAIVDEETSLPIPKNLSYVEAASIPESYHTVWYNVFMKGQLKKGEVFLVHGGVSGLGSAAIQIAKNIGATVITTVGTDEKVAVCKELLADCVINYKYEAFEKIILQFTDNQGVDVILDWIGASYFSKHIDLLKSHGRLLTIANMSGGEASLNFRELLNKSLTINGSLLRPLSIEKKAIITSAVKENLLIYLETGKIKPLIDNVFPLSSVNEALDRLKASQHHGKIILINNYVI